MNISLPARYGVCRPGKTPAMGRVIQEQRAAFSREDRGAARAMNDDDGCVTKAAGAVKKRLRQHRDDAGSRSLSGVGATA